MDFMLFLVLSLLFRGQLINKHDVFITIDSQKFEVLLLSLQFFAILVARDMVYI